MNISIILPVYNGSETLRECLECILNINYDKNKYELVVIDDGSLDCTGEIVNGYEAIFREKQIKFKFQKFKQNRGRIKARIAGAGMASFEYLLFIDHRCLIHKESINCIIQKKFEPIVGNPYQAFSKNIISRFFVVFRTLLYSPYFGESYPDVYIDRVNFDKIPKGFSPFFCKKDRFFRSLPEKRGKWVSDDTLLLSNLISESNILKTASVMCEYKERTSISEFVRHLYHRGPLFIDYYFRSQSNYVLGILICLLVPAFLVASVLGCNASVILSMLGLGLISVFLIVLSLRFSVFDAFSVMVVGPFALLVFSSGLYLGIYNKFIRSKLL